MSSWRDEASDEAQEDVDELLNLSLSSAQVLLAKNGEFFPFGVSVREDGERQFLGADPDLGERPESTAVLDSLLTGVRHEADGLRAVALVADVRADGTDAIRVEIEHREGFAMAVLLSYQKRRLRKTVEYGDLSAAAADRRVWL